MVVGTYQLVTLCHLYQLINLSGIYQMIASHNELVFRDGRRHIIVVVHLYQAATFDMEQARLTQ